MARRKNSPGINQLCSVDGCTSNATGRGMCSVHYGRAYRAGSLDVRRATDWAITNDRVVDSKPSDICSVESCASKVLSRRLCNKHYQRQRIHGDPLKSHTRDRAGLRLTAQGYIEAKALNHPNSSPYGRILQHRLVMSQHIGRALRDDENVHHINGDRSDNRIENLELWSTSQPPGQRIEDKVRWAEEILRTHGPRRDDGVW